MIFRKRKRMNWKTRATIGGLAIAVAALYALAVSWDISPGRLIGYLLGSIVLVLGTMLAAALLVVLIKLLGAAVRKLLP